MANVLTRLARTIESRQGADEKKSYAAKLFKRGPKKCAEKFGEEAVVFGPENQGLQNTSWMPKDMVLHSSFAM